MPETIKGVDMQRIDARAKEILGVVLAAQGRDPDSFATSEFNIAFEQALSEDAMAAPKIVGLAEAAGEIGGVRMWRLDGELIDDDTLVARIEKQHASENQMRELDRELGLTTPMYGLELHKAAEALLASRGKGVNYTTDEYIRAVEEVSRAD
jgi:hypothetical protein